MDCYAVVLMSFLVIPRINSFDGQKNVKEECIPRSSSCLADQEQFQSKAEEIFLELYQTKFKVFETWIIDILRRQEQHLKILKRKVADIQGNWQQKFSVTRVSNLEKNQAEQISNISKAQIKDFKSLQKKIQQVEKQNQNLSMSARNDIQTTKQVLQTNITLLESKLSILQNAFSQNNDTLNEVAKGQNEIRSSVSMIRDNLAANFTYINAIINKQNHTINRIIDGQSHVSNSTLEMQYNLSLLEGKYKDLNNTVNIHDGDVKDIMSRQNDIQTTMLVMQNNITLLETKSSLLQNVVIENNDTLNNVKEGQNEIRNSTAMIRDSLGQLETISLFIGEDISQQNKTIERILNSYNEIRNRMESVVAENNNQTSEIAMMRNVSLDKDEMLTLKKMINNISNVINVRLVNGSTWTEGRVEVFYNGEWGTVCDDTWTDENARVICRHFGYFSGEPFPAAKFGKGEGRIWLDDVDCEGSESNIFDCAHDSIGTHNCGHHKDAGVSCMKIDRLSEALCTFEPQEDCFLENSTRDDFDWTTRSGSTPSSGTGPSSASSGLYYSHIDVSHPKKSGDTASLVSKKLITGGEKCLRFDYHMWGKTMGTLKVFRFKEGNDGGFNHEMFSLSGEQGSDWNSEAISFTSVESYKLKIDGIKGSDFEGDIAIDNVRIVPGKCENCSSGWISYGSSCYKFVESPIKTWTDAKAYCSTMKSYLVEIENSSENNFLRRYLDRLPNTEETQFWIGNSDIDNEGVWTWATSGSMCGYTDWMNRTNEPNGGLTENCGTMYAKFDYHWNDFLCLSKSKFICENHL